MLVFLDRQAILGLGNVMQDRFRATPGRISLCAEHARQFTYPARRIEKVNPAVNAVVAFDPGAAEARAARLDDALARGEDVGPLAGLETAHKDLTETADFPTTYGSPVFAAFRPPAERRFSADWRVRLISG